MFLLYITLFVLIVDQSYGRVVVPKLKNKFIQQAVDGVCNLDVNDDLPDLEPLILLGKPNDYTLFQPTESNGQISLTSEQEVTLACLGKGNTLYAADEVDNTTYVNEYVITCYDDKTFIVEESKDHKETVSSLHCKRNSPSSLVDLKLECAEDSYKFQIGYDVGNFAPLFDGCIHVDSYQTLYSHYFMSKALLSHESEVVRPKFKNGGFYDGISMNKLYSAANQLQAFTEILGSESANKFLNRSADLYLARGHLAAKAEFTLAPYQTATFFYENAAPQWQIFNAGNWEEVEFRTRTYVENHNINGEIYTGTLGVSTLPDDSGEEQPLYLDGNNQSVVIPKFYWKMIYDDASKSGVVFVGLNAPYKTSMESDDYICEDVCDEISWAPEDRKDFQLGYVYCCSISNFLKNVPYVDDERFENVTKLLK